MKSAYNLSFKLTLMVMFCDFIALNVALLFCHVMDWWPMDELFHIITIKDIVFANIAYAVALVYQPVRLHQRQVSLATALSNVANTVVLFILIYLAVLGMEHIFVPGYFRSLTVMAIVGISILTERMLVRKVVKNMRRRGHGVTKAIILGYDPMVERVVNVMDTPVNGFSLLGMFADGHDREAFGERWLGKPEDVRGWLESNPVDEIYIALGAKYDQQLKPLLETCEQKMIRVYYIPNSHSTAKKKTKTVEFGDIHVMALYIEPLMNPKNRLEKRLFDIVFSTLLLALVFWWVYAIVAVITKLTMPGPVFFKQKRTGYNGNDFYVLKFRSMKVNDLADKKQATKDDPRVTKWGALMRHTNIDELPQFLNVLKGDMSVVGPRPHMLAHTEYYSERISDYMVRHYVKPGVTGWAQTHGERGETESVEDMERRVEKDIWYIEHWNFWLDIQIILKTIKDMIRGDKKAY